MMRPLPRVSEPSPILVFLSRAFPLLAYFFLVGRFWWVNDDAFISFRYARNLVAGEGLRYNLGNEAPVEGYTNFLWVLWCAVVEGRGGDPTFWVPLSSVVCGAILLVLLDSRLRGRLGLSRPVAFLTVLVLALFPPFAVWATGGLETMAFALAFFLSFDQLVLRRDGRGGLQAGISGLALALLRFDGIAWAGVVGAVGLLSRALAGERFRRPLSIYAGMVGGGFIIYYLWRLSYYGLAFPLPVYTKVGFGAPLLERGFNYLATFFLTFLSPFLLLPACWVARRTAPRPLLLALALLASTPLFYSIVLGGDWMVMGRFLVPGFAASAVIAAWALEAGWRGSGASRRLTVGASAIAVVLGLLPAGNVHLLPESFRARFRFMYSHPGFASEYERWRQNAEDTRVWKEHGLALRAVSEPGDSVVVGAIGALGYYSGLYVYDRFGLVNREVALLDFEGPPRSPGHDIKISRDFFLDRLPTFLIVEEVPARKKRVVETAEEWRSWTPTLFRSYLADFVSLPARPGEDRDRLLLFLKAIEDPDEKVKSLPRPARRQIRSEHAKERWQEFYRKACRLPE
jgi:arabinofuranosyltransferase